MASGHAEIEDPLGIYDVVAAYCQAYDNNDRAELERVFSPDARLRILGGSSRGDEAVGREDVLAWLTGRWPSVRPCLHLSGNLRFSPAGQGAEGTADFLFLIKMEDGTFQISSAGRYFDRYARHEGRWVIAERSITFLGEPV